MVEHSTGSGTGAVPSPQVLAYRRSPARELSTEMQQGSSGAVQLFEVAFLTQVSLRAVLDSPSAQGLEAVLGTHLPRKVGDVAQGPGAVWVLWLAPDEFLAIAPDEAGSGVAPAVFTGRLADALGDLPGQVVDLSANRTTLQLSGAAARAVLAKGCRVDLHPRAFGVDTAVATLLGPTPVILWRTAEETWRVLVRASFTTHTVRWLLDGMREYRDSGVTPRTAHG